MKFIEAFWRFLFYATFCVVGINTLFFPTRALWTVDHTLMWKDWHYHETSDIMKFYYFVELGQLTS